MSNPEILRRLKEKLKSIGFATDSVNDARAVRDVAKELGIRFEVVANELKAFRAEGLRSAIASLRTGAVSRMRGGKESHTWFNSERLKNAVLKLRQNSEENDERRARQASFERDILQESLIP